MSETEDRNTNNKKEWKKYPSSKPHRGSGVEMRFKPSNRPKMDLFAIYPDFWERKWGNPPLLGFIHAEDSFNAIRKAEFREIYRRNISFGIQAVKVEDRSVRLGRRELYGK